MKTENESTTGGRKNDRSGESKAVGLSAEEKAAMKARIKELKRSANKAEEENALHAAIEAMSEPDRSVGKRLHAIITANAPGLSPKTWYGMPAYANEEGKVVCFFRGSDKFKERYLTFGFNQEARLDDGVFWPIVFAVQGLTPAVEERIAGLMKKAVS